jgi:hypothetical protein
MPVYDYYIYCIKFINGAIKVCRKYERLSGGATVLPLGGRWGGPSAIREVQLAATRAHTYCRQITVAETGGHILNWRTPAPWPPVAPPLVKDGYINTKLNYYATF